MEEIQIAPEITDNGAKPGLPDAKPERVRLPDLPHLLLGQSEQNAWKASDDEFQQFAAGLVEIQVEEGDTLERPWLWLDRVDFINWALDEQVLTIKENRLVANEEHIPTEVLASGECLE